MHGGTGLRAQGAKLDSFNPFKDPIVFGSQPLKVRGEKDYEVMLKDEVFSVSKGKEAELPEFAAVYFICKRVARPVE